MENKIIELENGKKYLVISSTLYENNIYCLLVNQENEEEMIIAQVDNETIEIINDQKLYNELTRIFYDII